MFWTILKYFCITWWCLQSALLIWIIHQVFDKHLPANRNLPKEVKKKYFSYIRPELDNITHQKWPLILSALTWGGLRFTMMVFWVFFWQLVRLFTLGADPDKPYSRLRRFLVKIVFRWTCRWHLFCYGTYYLNVKKVRIQDYDPDYPEPSEEAKKRRAPIVVMNHVGNEPQFGVSLYDGVGMSRYSVKNWPFIGPCYWACQCFYIKRTIQHDPVARKAQLDRLTTRLNLTMENETMPQLLIFPEGTTSNN